MTLHVGGNIGLGQQQEAAAHATWDSYDDVFMELSMKGFDPPGRPPFPRPLIHPDQYTRLEGDAYSILMGQVDCWFEYTSCAKAEIEGRLITIRNEMYIIGVDLRATIRNEVALGKRPKPAETVLRDLVKEQPRFRELLKLEQDLEVANKQITAILEALERYAKGLSRQVTLRGQNVEMTNMDQGRRGLRRLTPP